MLNAVKGCVENDRSQRIAIDDASDVAINAAGIDGPELKSNVVKIAIIIVPLHNEIVAR